MWKSRKNVKVWIEKKKKGVLLYKCYVEENSMVGVHDQSRCLGLLQ